MKRDSPTFTTTAERDVWQVLNNALRPDDVLLANTRFTDTRGDHESDLILGLAGAGIAIIEVKGGRVTHNGTDWVQHGGTSKTIRPVDQARRAKYALRTYLDAQDLWARRRVRLAHLVAFPYSTFPADFSLPDCPRSMILDRNDLADLPRTVAWEALMSQDTDVAPATAEDLRVMLGCLQPEPTSIDEQEVFPAGSHLLPDGTNSVALGRVSLVVGVAAASALLIVGLAATAGQRGGNTTESGAVVTSVQPSAEGELASDVNSGRDPFTIRGTGTQVVSLDTAIARDSLVSVTHKGPGPFMASSLDADRQRQQLLVNTVGTYSGTTLLTADVGQAVAQIAIVADGEWSLNVRDVSEAREFGSTIAGRGDDVVRYVGGMGVLAASYPGDAPFVVLRAGRPDRLLFDEVGPFAGKTALGMGPALLVVSARGPWALTVTP